MAVGGEVDGGDDAGVGGHEVGGEHAADGIDEVDVSDVLLLFVLSFDTNLVSFSSTRSMIYKGHREIFDINAPNHVPFILNTFM